MRNGGARTADVPRCLALLLVLGALIVAAACPRGVLATLRLANLGEPQPVEGVASGLEMDEPRQEAVVAIAPLIRRRMLGTPAPSLPSSDTECAAPLVTTLALTALAGSLVFPPRSRTLQSAITLARRQRAPPLQHASI